jgi:hypothetical protein
MVSRWAPDRVPTRFVGVGDGCRRKRCPPRLAQRRTASMEVVGSRFGVAAATSLAFCAGLALAGVDISSPPTRSGVALSANARPSGASIKTWIYIHGSRTHWYVVQQGPRAWRVQVTGTEAGGACWVRRGQRGYTFITYSLNTNVWSYAVPGVAGRWRFQEAVTSNVVLGSIRATTSINWDIFDRLGHRIAVSKGPDGVVAGLAWVTHKVLEAEC